MNDSGAGLLIFCPDEKKRWAGQRWNCVFVNGVLWVLRSGARWSDLPERYGKYKSVHKRFVRWAAKGVWDQVFRTLTQDMQNEYLIIDSPSCGRTSKPLRGRDGCGRCRF